MRAIILALGCLLAFASASNEKKVVCYFGSWSVYRPGNGKFDISYIDPTLCTHMIYTFVGLGEDGSIRVLDGWQDLADNWGKDGFGRFNKLREVNPKVKTMVAIGGWNEGSTKYSHVMANPTLRQKFVQSAYDFVKKYGFDGFDMDWEYPNQRGGVEADKKNFVQLLKELRQKFDPEGLLLSAAVGAAEVSAGKSYIISEVAKYLHFINLMTYDLHGIWDKKTGINAPLYAGSWEQGAEKKLNVDASVKYWLEQGAPAEKIVVGVPLYGRGFTLVNSQQNGIGAPANEPARAGPYTREPGMLGYNEICEKIKNEQWKVTYQKEQRVPYAFKGNQWVGYDDKRSLKEKAEYVNKMGLGGMMVWSVETDDFKGLCGEKYPLLKAINNGLRSGSLPSPSDQFEEKQPESSGDYENEFSKDENQEDNKYHDESNDDNIDDQDQYQEPSNSQEQQPSVGSGDICKEEGYVKDPQNPELFYYCQLLNGQYMQHPYQCPAGLVYDSCLKVCNWKDQAC